ncbi:EbsA family protein [Lactococcus nasutitermitis]|uniref:EbsA family protein n=1 Tax=Lactococcus nasutitermitis TaxID=1652957 RepID=A0ABV9JFL2_9LACT|nr:EbsA family protein [Lactococcus nasutitermitis]
MKSGFFLPFSNGYKIAWIWCVIVFSFERIIFYELNKHGNWFLTLLTFIVYVTVVVLIWPHRFFVSDGHLNFPTFPRLKMRDFDLKYVTAVRKTVLGLEFSYAGKRYQFITFGKSKAILAGLEENKHEEMAQVKA